MRTQGFDTDKNTLDRKKNLVSDWKKLLQSELKKPEAWFPEIAFTDRLGKSGTVLEGIELADAASFIKSSVLLRKYCTLVPDNITLSGALSEEAELLPDLTEYSKAILAEINPDGTVKDNHPELRSARSRIAGLHGKINRITSSYLNDNSEIWQTGTSTQRDGRILLPVKANYRGRVKGLVHEVSSSGATVFVEPFDLVELNNDMAYEQSMLNQLVFKIYRKLTDRLREATEEFIRLTEQVYFIDSWYARAEFSIRNNCIRPEDRDRGIIIKKGRHLLLGSSAVPISLSFADDLSVLIITGPNAGGKTVTLKTCGLFVLLNQFASELPAEEGTALGIYGNVFADIGDDQSIEESLSTFSGHMKRISEIIRQADAGTLVLLDELGSGTDPSQGSAIASAVLEHLHEKNISTVTTSHHAAIKKFGYTREGAVNASVSFDSETMKPTYEIIEGVPGESHAVEIAQTMGLPESVIRSAEKYYDDGDTTVSGMIRELEKRQYEIIERDRRLAEEEKRNKEDRRVLDLTRLKLRQAEHQIKQQDYSKLKNFVRDSRKELENLVRELREGEISKEKTKKVKKHIAALEAKLGDEKKELDDEQDQLDSVLQSESKVSGIFEAGAEVRYLKNNKSGVLVEKRKKDSWLVAFGNIKLPLKEKELELISGNPRKQEQTGSYGNYQGGAVFELDIRGMRVYEAETALVKQIDSALLAGLNSFSIIHGLGEGVLQKTVGDFLRTCNSVKSFEYSDPEQGGFGKTVVRL